MATLKKIKTLFACLIIAISSNAQTLSGRDIIQKSLNRPDGDTRSSEITMQLTNSKGNIRVRKIISYYIDIKNDTKSLMFFEYPGDVKGTGLLTWNYNEIGKEDDKWLYLPAMKQTRRISSSSAKKDYFMGSDFTYDDLGNRNVDEDTHQLLREEDINGHQCWVVESTSKDSRDIYSRKISWIRQDCLIAIKVDLYDKQNKLQRELNVSDIVNVDGFWLGKKMEMKNVQTNHQTILIFENPKYNIAIDESAFTVARLEKGSI